MNDLDAFSAPLASITGRLQKLRANNDHLQYGEVTSREQLAGLFFEIGLLIDLLDELTWKVSDILPVDGTGRD
jgi:hypothetical protein